MRTRSGIYINILSPTEDMFDIDDIAHALAMIPRFGGHLPIWYSVADHSLRCARIAEESGCSKQNIFNCLMHDCTEPYLGDVVSPLKNNLKDYQVIEANFMNILQTKFKFEINNVVKIVDKAALEIEWSFLLSETKTIERDWKTSKKIFLEAYYNYKP